jgi:hypothetical protein
LSAGWFAWTNELDASRQTALSVCTAEQLQQRGAELFSGSGWTYVGAVSKRNGPDRHGRCERHSSKLRAILHNHARHHSDPEASFDEAEYRVHLAPFDGETWLKSCSLAG